MLTLSHPARPSQPGAIEQREWYRYSCGRQIYCRVNIDGVIDFWAIGVHNLSTGGIKLMLDVPIPRGKEIAVVLYNPARRYSCQRQVQVAYSQQAGKVQHLVGGAFFKELSAQEMKDLL